MRQSDGRLTGKHSTTERDCSNKGWMEDDNDDGKSCDCDEEQDSQLQRRGRLSLSSPSPSHKRPRLVQTRASPSTRRTSYRNESYCQLKEPVGHDHNDRMKRPRNNDNHDNKSAIFSRSHLSRRHTGMRSIRRGSDDWKDTLRPFVSNLVFQ